MELYIARKEDGEVTNELIFILSKMLVFQDQYLEFVLGTPPDNAALFGMGESTRAVQQLQVNSTYTLWNTDIASAVFDAALYGTHPFLIQISATGKASGIMFMNSNAMDVSIFQSDSMGNSVGVQSTGGIIDLYVFAGPTPADVVRQFLEVVGKPAMVPYWSLGFHNCKVRKEFIHNVPYILFIPTKADMQIILSCSCIITLLYYICFYFDTVGISEHC